MVVRKLSLAVLALTLLAGSGAQPAPQDPPPKKKGPRPVHDPSTIVKHGQMYWLFATGRGVTSWRSKDLVAWEPGPPVFAESPKWVADVVPGNRGDFWAPDVIRHGDRYLVYYSVSTFGKNTSVIALASSPTLDPEDPKYKWTDHGVVIRSSAKDDYNAIDPGIVRGPNDTLWMAFGSFWSGIKLVQLDPKTGLRLAADSPIHALANKEQIEAVAIYRHADYFYQFVNWGWCCRGAKSTYNIRVGRSKEITGPYLDKDGVDLRKGGGSLLLDTDGRFIGPGHAGILKEGDRLLLSYHFYDGDRGGRSALAIRALEWDKDGWPRVTGKPITPPEEAPVQPKEKKPDAKTELMDADRAFAKATAEKGIDGWMSFMADDAVRIAPLGEKAHTGKDAVRKLDAAMFAAPKRKLLWEPTDGGAFADGKHGFTTGKSKMVTRNEKGEDEVLWTGAYVTMWRKGDDGRWKVILDTGSLDPAKK